MTPRVRSLILLSAFLLALVPAGAAAATDPAYSTTYTITLREDGSASWQIEYRTLLATESDLAAFDNYTRDLPAVYLPQVQDLMEHSAAQASVAASRPMHVSNVTGTAVIQTSPTGRYGVVMYACSWSGFAAPDGDLAAGDAFAGGLYLARDSTLVVRYPPGWSVTRTEPSPDSVRDDSLVWYGLRSFSPGEPRITLGRPAFPATFPLVPAGILILLLVLAGTGFMVYRRRRGAEEENADQYETSLPPATEESANLEERIVRLLADAGGELYQSAIIRSLGVPKSTVSSAIAGLHARGVVVKVRRGRENLIRLVRPDGLPVGRGGGTSGPGEGQRE